MMSLLAPEGGEDQCRSNAGTSFAGGAMDNDRVIGTVQQDIKYLAILFMIVHYQFAVHSLHHPVDGVAFYFLFLNAFQEYLPYLPFL